MYSRSLALSPAFLALALVLPSCAEAPTTASVPRLIASDGTPVVGRLQLRDETVELTRTAIASDGPARDLARGVAQLTADVDRFRVGAEAPYGGNAAILRAEMDAAPVALEPRMLPYLAAPLFLR